MSAPLADVLRSLADPTRLALLERIARDGEVSVGGLVARAGVSQPAVSQHLRALRMAGLVQERRSGRQVLYRAAPEGLAPLVDWLARHAVFWRERFDTAATLRFDTTATLRFDTAATQRFDAMATLRFDAMATLRFDAMATLRFDAMATLLQEIDTMTGQKPRSIVIERRLAHPPEQVWRILTDPRLITRWLMPNDFAPVLGQRFTLQTKPMGDWDGVVRCEVLAIEPPRLLRYSWRGGADSNPRYGARLDTTVTWTLAPDTGGTLLRMVHDGFASPGNDFAHDVMQPGWIRAVETMARLAAG